MPPYINKQIQREGRTLPLNPSLRTASPTWGENRRIIKGSVPGANYPIGTPMVTLLICCQVYLKSLVNSEWWPGSFRCIDWQKIIECGVRLSNPKLPYPEMKTYILSIYVWMKLLLFMFELLVLPIIRKLIHLYLYIFVCFVIHFVTKVIFFIIPTIE